MKNNQEKNYEEEPTVLAVPCNRTFVVDNEKAKEFNSLKPNKV